MGVMRSAILVLVLVIVCLALGPGPAFANSITNFSFIGSVPGTGPITGAFGFDNTTGNITGPWSFSTPLGLLSSSDISTVTHLRFGFPDQFQFIDSTTGLTLVLAFNSTSPFVGGATIPNPPNGLFNLVCAGECGIAFGLSGVATPLISTPDPSSMLLLGTGLLGLAPMFRRRFSRTPAA